MGTGLFIPSNYGKLIKICFGNTHGLRVYFQTLTADIIPIF